jgi:antitoxin component YwqK of YwqJK toxin-antitoxin module
MTFRVLSTTFLALSLLVSCQTSKNQDKNIIKVSYVHRYGVPITEADWSTLGKTGEIETSLKSGVRITRSYKDGVLDGKSTTTYPHSEVVQKEETFKDGLLASLQKNYTNGTPQEQVDFLKDGKVIKVWYESGTPKSVETLNSNLLSEAQYFNDKHEMDARVINLIGTRKIRDNFGRVITVDNIVNGKMALQTTFYPNQEPKAITPYKDDLIHGERKTFLSKGVPQTIEQWESGKQHGITVSFINGEKSSSAIYLNGKKQGVELRFTDNGNQVVEEIHWVSGIKHGEMRTFLPNNQTQIEYYFRGRLVSKVVFDDLEHKVR